MLKDENLKWREESVKFLDHQMAWSCMPRSSYLYFFTSVPFSKHCSYYTHFLTVFKNYPIAQCIFKALAVPPLMFHPLRVIQICLGAAGSHLESFLPGALWKYCQWPPLATQQWWTRSDLIIRQNAPNRNSRGCDEWAVMKPGLL